MADDIKKSNRAEAATASEASKAPQDIFLLDKVYQKPKTVFSVRTPHIKILNENCLFVFDTNALLAPYKIGAGEAEEISRIISDLAAEDRVFVPSRAAQEFAKNQHLELNRLYDTVHGWSSKIGGFELSAKFPMLEKRQSYNDFLSACQEMRESKKKYSDALNKIMDDLREWCWDDPISDAYSKIFVDSRVIDIAEMTQAQIKEELEYRQNNKVPPGYKDQGKADEGIGDLLIWFTLIKIASTHKRHILFVCNEEKADWMVSSQKVPLIVRPELTHEFYNKTGFYFDIVNFSTFLTLRNATEGIVNLARSVEDEDTFTPWEMAKQIHETLSLITKMLSDYVESNSPSPLIDGGLDTLAQRFRALKFKFDVSGMSIYASGVLSRIDSSLSEMRNHNNSLRHGDGRMHEVELNYLMTLCDRIFTDCERWASWYSSDFPR